MLLTRGRTLSCTPKNCLAVNMRSLSDGYFFEDLWLLAWIDKGLLYTSVYLAFKSAE